MKFKAISTLVAATALLATPVLAQADLAERAASPASSAEELEGNGMLIAIVAAAAVIAGIIIIAADGDDEPTSP